MVTWKQLKQIDKAYGLIKMFIKQRAYYIFDEKNYLSDKVKNDRLNKRSDRTFGKNKIKIHIFSEVFIIFVV